MTKEYQKEWRDKNIEHVRARSRKYQSEHKEQRAAHWQKFYEKNKEQIKKRAKDYVEANREKTLSHKRSYYAANKEKFSQQHKEWNQKNKEKTTLNNLKRIANKQNSVVTLTAEQAKRIRKGKCFFCGMSENIVIAHNIPVSKHGNTTLANVFSACQTCNLKMRTKTLEEMITQLSYSV